MAYDLSQLRTAKEQTLPPRIIIHGPPGVGKTIFSACAPNPIILPTEDGLASLKQLPFDVPAFPKAETWGDVTDALEALAMQEHSFQTLAVDSLDWLEPIIWQETCRRNSWNDIEQPGYGKGYLAAQDVWRQFLDGLEYLRTQKGMAYILIAHSMIKRFDAPDAEPYDRYMLKLQQKGADLLTESADAVIFANFKTYTATSEVGFNKKVRRGVGTGERIMFTEERPAFVAKNRYGLPAEMTLDYAALANAINPAPTAPVEEATTEEGETTNG